MFKVCDYFVKHLKSGKHGHQNNDAQSQVLFVIWQDFNTPRLNSQDRWQEGTEI